MTFCIMASRSAFGIFASWASLIFAKVSMVTPPSLDGPPAVPMLCVYGQDEEQSLCMDLRPDEATIKSLPGSHHFNGEYAKVAALILEHLKRP